MILPIKSTHNMINIYIIILELNLFQVNIINKLNIMIETKSKFINRPIRSFILKLSFVTFIPPPINEEAPIELKASSSLANIT